jgi:phospholipase C
VSHPPSSKLVAMTSQHKIALASPLLLGILFLAACQGLGNSPTTTTTTPNLQLTVTGPTSATGTVTSSPAGISCPGTCSASFASNTQVTLTAKPASNEFFGGWSGGGCSGTSTCAVTLTATTSVAASFNAGDSVTVAVTGTGTVTSSPAGINCPGTCSAGFAPNSQVTLTETPATGEYFGGWSGGGCSGASTCAITLTAATNVTAAFTGGDALTVALTGTGTVISSPAGINCPTTCSANFAPGTQVSLSETPASGQYFGGWSGGCSGAGACAVTVSAATNVAAAFSPGVAVTVALAGAGTGTVTSNPAGITCSATATTTCSASFAPNSVVALSETPATNDTFAGWSGGCTGTAGCSLTVTAASDVTATFGGSLANINHIILFAQENRSFDHYFGAMRQYWADNNIPDQQFDGLPQFTPPFTAAPPSIPGCNIADSATDCSPDPSNPITSFHLTSACIENPSPFWNESHNDWDYADPADQPAEVNSSGQPDPPLNGFVWTAAYDARSDGFMDVMGVRAMGYYEGTDLNYYYALASDFGVSDRWFAPMMSRTELNRMYMLSATSHGYAYPLNTSDKDNTPLPNDPIFERLQAAGISWKIYMDAQGLSYNGQACSATEVSDANGLCLIQSSYINMFTYEQTIINSAGQNPDMLINVVPIGQFAIDAANGTLPQFALIEPASAAGLDEHPSDSDGYPVNVQAGQQYVADSIVNPLLKSPSWTDSALIFMYDEAGGLYDHVSPQPAALPGDGYNWPVDLDPLVIKTGQQITNDICTKPGEVEGEGTCSFGWTAYRIPNVVISPYALKNYVSHTVRDTTSVLAMVEARFGLQPLTGRDAAQPSMNEFFDFVNKPWATPPTLPTPIPPNNTQQGTLPCDQTPPASWQEPPLLTVSVTGGGSVTSSPGSGIDGCTSSCSSTFATGTVVTLTATPNSGSTFTGWSGGGCSGAGMCTLTLTSSDPQTTVTATFNP